MPLYPNKNMVAYQWLQAGAGAPGSFIYALKSTAANVTYSDDIPTWNFDQMVLYITTLSLGGPWGASGDVHIRYAWTTSSAISFRAGLPGPPAFSDTFVTTAQAGGINTLTANVNELVGPSALIQGIDVGSSGITFTTPVLGQQVVLGVFTSAAPTVGAGLSIGVSFISSAGQAAAQP